MLEEYNSPGEREGDYIKRWFCDSFFDLFIWFDQKGIITSFQLCYDKSHDEHALTWKFPSTYYHQQVDDGENKPGKSKSTPILLSDGLFDFRAMAERFSKEGQNIDPEIRQFVYQKILEFRNHAAA